MATVLLLLFTGTATRTHSPFIRADRAERAHPSVILCSALCVLLPLVNPWNRMGDMGCWGSACPCYGGEQQLHLVSMLCFPSDASLTLPKVLAAVRTVRDVRTLGRYVLELPGTKRDEVRQQSASVEERREGLVKYYMDTHPNASWEGLGGRLLYVQEEAAMEEVKVHIKPTEGEYGVQCAILVAATGQFLSI